MNDKQNFQQDELPDEFTSLEEAGEFWDTHSITDYEEFLEPVEFEVDLPPRAGKRIHLAQDLVVKVGEIAKQQGVSVEVLVNLWLQEKVAHTFAAT